MVNFMIVRSLKWVGGVEGFLELIDQRRLPSELVKLQCRDVKTVCEAVKSLAVRGAPAIGVTGAYGLVLAMQKLRETDDLEEGLFVLGEANYSDHGANRLGASALMQGLSDGYFVIPYTIANYLAQTTPGKAAIDNPEFKPVVDFRLDCAKKAGGDHGSTRQLIKD